MHIVASGTRQAKTAIEIGELSASKLTISLSSGVLALVFRGCLALKSLPLLSPAVPIAVLYYNLGANQHSLLPRCRSDYCGMKRRGKPAFFRDSSPACSVLLILVREEVKPLPLSCAFGIKGSSATPCQRPRIP